MNLLMLPDLYSLSKTIMCLTIQSNQSSKKPFPVLYQK